MFCYLDFRSFFKAYYPKSLPFALKSTFPFEIHRKKLLSTPKTVAKTTKPIADMTKARHSSMLPGSTNWPEDTIAIYTSIAYIQIFRERLSEKVHATNLKGNMGYDQYTSWQCSCQTYFCCFPWRTVNSKPPTIPFGIVACTFSDNLFRNSCRWAGRLYRLLTPRAVHSLCAWRDYKRRGAQGASLRSEIHEKEPRSTWRNFGPSLYRGSTVLWNITSRSKCMGR